MQKIGKKRATIRRNHVLVREASMQELKLRKVTKDDCDLLFEWANDELCRNNSIQTKHIERAEHEAWFAKKLQDQNCKMYICTLGDEEIGQIRFDKEDNHAIISYSIAKEHRGKGYAAQMVALAEKRVQEESIQKIRGVVKKENIPSKKVFESLGYEMESTNIYDVFNKILR